MGELRIMMGYSLAIKCDIDKNAKAEIEAGDTKLMWDSENDMEVTAVKNTFDTLIGKGFTAFKVKKNGEAGDKVTEFNPDAEKLILIAPMAGG